MSIDVYSNLWDIPNLVRPVFGCWLLQKSINLPIDNCVK